MSSLPIPTGFLERNYRSIALIAVGMFIGGLILSHRVEPGVRVQSVTIAGGNPALEFIPTGFSPHPVAMLAHGYTGTKENFYCYAEALAAAGFLCYSVDQPGHGMSPRPFSLTEAVSALEEVARAVGPVDVFIGHSMGGFTGGEAVREGRLPVKLFVAVGSSPQLGEHGPPLLLLTGRFDEFFSAEIKARTDARWLVSPWSNHGSELSDPVLVKAVVEAACAAVGKSPPPSAPTSWLWRLIGLAFCLLGGLGMAFFLPKLPAEWGWLRGPLVAGFLIVAFMLCAGSWLDVRPHGRFLPLQMLAMAITWLILTGAARIHMARWVLLALAAVVWALCFIMGVNLPGPRAVLISSFLMPTLLLGTVIAGIASRRGLRRDGDIAMAIIIGCALFQWVRLPRIAEVRPKSHTAIKLETKFYDACVGRYEFAPDNVFPSGLKLTIRREGERLIGQALGRRVYPGEFDIYAESETNFFLTNGVELIFVRNAKREVTGVISRMDGMMPDSEGKKVSDRAR